MTAQDQREQFNLVIVGHVDHGKSTVIGRLLADTGSLPEGKLEYVKELCRKTAKPFEYAFLLDALKDEREQGITIDAARCFFKSGRRDYIITDAPGHVEFLKNMITGASRADAALLVIDAAEGIMENSRRHGYILSLLGIRQISVLVNKMDAVGYDMSVFERVKNEFGAFLSRIGVKPVSFIPICAVKGENIVERASWSTGPTVIEQINAFSIGDSPEKDPFRMPVQAVYKFTEEGDDRRIIAGQVDSGTIRVGDEVVFQPSGKRSRIETIEAFNVPPKREASYGESCGVTLRDELYLKPGEIMARVDERAPMSGTRFRVQLFWMGRSPLIRGKRYKLKLGASRVAAYLSSIESVLDATDFSLGAAKAQVDRHDIATCVIETAKQVAFDLPTEIAATGRFVIVDSYEIAGAGIILGEALESRSIFDTQVEEREERWEKSEIGAHQRASRLGHRPKFVLVSGRDESMMKNCGMMLEARLFDKGYYAYYLGLGSFDIGMDRDVEGRDDDRSERLRRLGELSRIMTDSGQIFITAIGDIESHEVRLLRKLNAPGEILVAAPADSDAAAEADLVFASGWSVVEAVDAICDRLSKERIIDDYAI